MKTKLQALERDAQSLERQIDNQIEFMQSIPDWIDDYDMAQRHLDRLMHDLSEVSGAIEDAKESLSIA